MEALGIASGAAGIISLGIVVCQGLLQYYGSCKDAESGVSDMYKSIEALAQILQVLLPALDNENLDRDIVAVIEQNVASCHQGIEKLGKKLAKVKITPLKPGWREKTKAQFRKTLYPFKESTLIKLKAIGNELRDQLSLALDVLQIDASAASLTKLDALDRHIIDVSTDVDCLKKRSGVISTSLNRLHDSVGRSSTGIDSLILSQSSDYLLKIFRWLSPLAGVFERKQLDIFNLKGRQDGVGEWLLETKEFNDWLDGNGKILWCPGKRNVPHLLSLSLLIHDEEIQGRSYFLWHQEDLYRRFCHVGPL